MPTAQCWYCGEVFEQRYEGQEFCRLGHLTSYRRRKAMHGDKPNRCPHTFKLNYDTEADAAAASYANSAEHSIYQCWCGKWHFGRIKHHQSKKF